ncbi:MAG: GNAT family N-acetyltransferase, partial [Tissierella sp.]|nr:GNAT family N-acetyltransferase [Tissierella sp.]
EYRLIFKKNHIYNDRLNFNIGELPIDYYGKLKELHDEIFPNVYISGADIIENIGKKHFVYSIIENKTLIAYSVLRLNGNMSGTAEIIAVREEFRGRGYGKAIISYLIDKAVNLFKVSNVDLMVDGDNEKAIKLYLDLGFVIEHENRCYIA